VVLKWDGWARESRAKTPARRSQHEAPPLPTALLVRILKPTPRSKATDAEAPPTMLQSLLGPH
jgi:hypothetical protein